MSFVIVFMSLFPLIVFLSLFWGLFDFSLLRTHFCLITEYSVEFRAALRGNFGDCGPKCESRGLRARYRLGFSRKPETATCATSFLRHRQRQYQRHIFRHGARDDELQFGRRILGTFTKSAHAKIIAALNPIHTPVTRPNPLTRCCCPSNRCPPAAWI